LRHFLKIRALTDVRYRYRIMRIRVIGLAVAVLAGSGAVAARAAGTDLPPGPQLGGVPAPDISQGFGYYIPGVTVRPPIATNPPVTGGFSAPFVEPGPDCPRTNGTTQPCKPAAASVAVLPNGKVLYFDALEGEQQVNLNVVAEFGDKAIDDQSRVLDPTNQTWLTPSPATGGASGSGYTEYLVPHAPAPLDQVLNDPGMALGALFCSDLVFLANGKLLTPGGTHYYEEPHLPGSSLGISELEGLRSTRIFDPATNTWSQSGDMNHGRWYPSLVTLPDGKVFVASGVTKLLKPMYPSHPLDSGTNVKQTETYDPATGKWTDNGASAAKTLPLYPRLHLLPDGKVYYDAGGQVFNPMGQSYDEPLWNFTSIYDPATRAWKDAGLPLSITLGAGHILPSVSAGLRGSSFSVMLPLTYPYTSASFLSAGGVLGTSPGAYFGTDASAIATVNTAAGDAWTSTATAPLNNARWFPTAVVLPTGQVMAFSGTNRDEVLGPGTSFPVTQAELFDPATRTWTPMASAHQPRGYHNTAVLLPGGDILIGGSSPITTLYTYNNSLPGGFMPNFRDPTFEIYKPPYLFWGPRPTITSAPSTVGYGGQFTIDTPSDVESVTLVRNTALTHLIDGDQRTIVLPITSHVSGQSITVSGPPSGAVAPPGPYMLFINTRTAKGLVPSVAAEVMVN
jgi:galactose oxidase-like protein